MSGGHFNYLQYRIGEIADEVAELIRDNDITERTAWGERIGYGFTAETIAEFRKGLKALREAEVYAQRIDWLVSGDDGEDNFRRRLADDLAKLAAAAALAGDREAS